MTRSLLAAELTLAEFKIFFLCVSWRASTACGGSEAASDKGRNLSPAQALEVHLVCWLVTRCLVKEILSFHDSKQLKYHHFQNTSSWLKETASTHLQQLAKRHELRESTDVCNGSPVRMVQKRYERAKRRLWCWRKLGIWMVFVSGHKMLKQEALWFAQMCTTVYLGLCSAFKKEQFPSYRQRCCFQKEVYWLHWVQITGCYESIAHPAPCVFKDVAVVDAGWLISGRSPHGDTSRVLRVIVQLTSAAFVTHFTFAWPLLWPPEITQLQIIL